MIYTSVIFSDHKTDQFVLKTITTYFHYYCYYCDNYCAIQSIIIVRMRYGIILLPIAINNNI